jgi:hypothetical protein
MTDQEMLTICFKILGIGLLLLIAVMLLQLLIPSTPDNCWNHYQTENAAILHCEKSK